MPETASLEAFQPQREFFVGLDSDGCVFDSMEIKHKECFTPVFIKVWNLQAASKFARRVWEFVNLYSVYRGTNRFPALVKSLDLLTEWPVAMARGIRIPDLAPLREFVDSDLPPSNASLQQLLQVKKDPLLERTLDWSLAVNAAISDLVRGVPPFPKVRESLEKIVSRADLAVVSGTPTEALVREWEEHGIIEFPALIAGQELGKKKHHLAVMTAGGRYGADRKLMIGDAPGDLQAARANDFLFFPVNPGHEEESWQRLYGEALDRFFAGTYAGDYEAWLIREFESLLPAEPPWKSG